MGTVLSKLFPNDYELVVTKSKELDHILETKFNATGASLNEKLGSVQSQLSPSLAKKIRYLIRIRTIFGNTSMLENRIRSIKVQLSFFNQ
ncbi:hypothetical protein BC833DRAFT_312681 [Globomyces pollinis-pini]|nr:hypothetical protein BC833DRAFT_312681 [Globomyces pollinis-pini]